MHRDVKLLFPSLAAPPGAKGGLIQPSSLSLTSQVLPRLSSSTFAPHCHSTQLQEKWTQSLLPLSWCSPLHIWAGAPQVFRQLTPLQLCSFFYQQQIMFLEVPREGVYTCWVGVCSLDK